METELPPSLNDYMEQNPALEYDEAFIAWSGVLSRYLRFVKGEDGAE